MEHGKNNRMMILDGIKYIVRTIDADNDAGAAEAGSEADADVDRVGRVDNSDLVTELSPHNIKTMI